MPRSASSAAVLRAMGFSGPTVPAVKIDGRRVQTTRALARALDELRPERPLFFEGPPLGLPPRVAVAAAAPLLAAAARVNPASSP